MQELANIEKGTELQTLTDGLPKFLELIKTAVDTGDVDINTKKGRAEIVSNAFKVTKVKTSIASKIDDLIKLKEKEIEPTLKIISTLRASKKTTDAELSALSKATRKSVTDWEIEEEKRIKAEKERLEAEALAIEIESDELSALVEDELFEMKLAKKLDDERIEREKLAAKEKEEKAVRDKKIADDATAKAKADSEAEKAKAIQDKINAQNLAAQAIIDKEVAEKLAAQQKIDDAETARKLKIENDEKARLLAIRTKEHGELVAENARLAEVKRQEDEANAEAARIAKIESNKKHVSSIRREIKEQFMKDAGIDEETAIKVVKSMIKNGRITISYE